MRLDIIGRLRFAWSRITANRITLIFAGLSLVYLILQTIFAVNSYFINTHATNVLKHIYDSQNIKYLDFTYYDRDTGVVTVCKSNDQAVNASSCAVIWPPSKAHNTTSQPPVTTHNTSHTTSTDHSTSTSANPSPTSSTSPSPTVSASATAQPSASSSPSKRSLGVQVVQTEVKSTKTMNITGLLGGSLKSKETVSASETCISVMKWPMQMILNETREDLARIFFQIWIFALTMIAVIYESVPHLVVTFIGHLMIAVWSAVELVHTLELESDYDVLIRGINGPSRAVGTLGQTGACDGQDLLPFYFGPRKVTVFVLSIVNFVGFLLSAFFVCKLYSHYTWATFKRIGASTVVNRCYRLGMFLLVCIQLSLYFVTTAVGLWVDQLFNGVFGPKARLVGLYRAGGIVVIPFIIPWLIIGWMALRRELRRWMLIFMAVSVFFVFCWIGQVLSDSWRLTYKYWGFFAFMEVCGFALTILICVLGVACRIYCFGRGVGELFCQSDIKETDVVFDEETVAGFERVNAETLANEETKRQPPRPLTLQPRPGDAQSVHSRADSQETLAESSVPIKEEVSKIEPPQERVEPPVNLPQEHSEPQSAWATLRRGWSVRTPRQM